VDNDPNAAMQTSPARRMARKAQHLQELMMEARAPRRVPRSKSADIRASSSVKNTPSSFTLCRPGHARLPTTGNRGRFAQGEGGHVTGSGKTLLKGGWSWLDGHQWVASRC